MFSIVFSTFDIHSIQFHESCITSIEFHDSEDVRVSNYLSPELPTLSIISQTDLYLILQVQNFSIIDSNPA